MRTAIPVCPRRRKSQRGFEIWEFLLLASFLIPTMMWMFVNAMNLVRMNEANQVTRDLGDLYIHGVDYSTYEAQNVAVKLATGFRLNIGASFTGNEQANTGNGGEGLINVAEIMYVGNASCSSLPNGTSCTNQNQYVFLQVISFGNGTLQINGSPVTSSMGAITAVTNSNGIVQNYLTDPNAVCATCASFFQTQLSDGQVAYVAETFFASPDLDISALPAGGVHNIAFF